MNRFTHINKEASGKVDFPLFMGLVLLNNGPNNNDLSFNSFPLNHSGFKYLVSRFKKKKCPATKIALLLLNTKLNLTLLF